MACYIIITAILEEKLLEGLPLPQMGLSSLSRRDKVDLI
jgi:hypothetical protein